ncbi:hypothetical protein CBR_g51549 [Chara braunii]|uniref:Uncharacterized protein n=1 Tax=Chara braunii TaxID=69332 RepID=A0A388M8V7_CHABU|nr:hypothetical protein CBR_g51549 [Chara braunii]|eukprot:GBG90945.1 hypothetical protein CBR_g51549 [Chara braunii]
MELPRYTNCRPVLAHIAQPGGVLYFAAVVNYSGRDLAVLCHLGLSSSLLYCIRIVSLYDLREGNTRRLIGDLVWFEHWSGYQRECQGVHEFVSRIQERPQDEWHQVEALSVVIQSLSRNTGSWGFHNFTMPNFNVCELNVLEEKAMWLRYVLAWWHARRGSMYMPSSKKWKVCLAWSLVSWPGLVACGLLADAVDTILVAAFVVFWQSLLLHLIVKVWRQEDNLANLSDKRTRDQAERRQPVDEFGGLRKVVLQYHLQVAANLTGLLKSALHTRTRDCVPSFDYGVPYLRKSVMVSRQTNKIMAVVRLLYSSGDAINYSKDGARCLIGMWSMEYPPYKPDFPQIRATELAKRAASGRFCNRDCSRSKCFEPLVQLAVAVWTRVKILNEPEYNRHSWKISNKDVVDLMEEHRFHSGVAVEWDPKAERPWSRGDCPQVGETLHALVCDIANMLQRVSLVEDEVEAEREEWMVVMALLMNQVWLIPKPLAINPARVWQAVVSMYARTLNRRNELPRDLDLIYDGTTEPKMHDTGPATLGFVEQVAHIENKPNADPITSNLTAVAKWLRDHARHEEVAELIWAKKPFIKL